MQMNCWGDFMLDVIYNRRSCRKFINKDVEIEKIEEVINAGLYAANGMGYQYGIVIAITAKDKVDKLRKLNAKILGNENIDPFYGANCVLLVAVKKWRNAAYDGACMIENMMLEATNQNLGSCWIHRAKEELESPDAKSIFKDLNINLDEYEGVGHVILGYKDNNEIAPKKINDNRIFWLK